MGHSYFPRLKHTFDSCQNSGEIALFPLSLLTRGVYITLRQGSAAAPPPSQIDGVLLYKSLGLHFCLGVLL